jgi:sugar/nucleoside kinase (ribokinase family)
MRRYLIIIPMKVVVVGNIAIRHEIKGRKKITTLAGGSYFAALQAAKLGHEVTLISRLSSNFPKEYIKKIESAGIKLIKQPSWETTEYDVEYHKDGSKTAIVHADAGPIMSVPKIDADVIIITSYIGHIGINVLKTLKTEDNLLALDAQGYTKYKKQDGSLTYVPWLEKEEYLKYVDLLKLNASELYYLTGKTTINSASELLKLGPKIVTLTLGTKGAYVFYDKKYMKVPVYENIKFVDKVGVGDVYTTAFAIKYKETQNIVDAAYFAAAATSYCVEKVGDSGIANLKKINKRFKTLKDIFLV